MDRKRELDVTKERMDSLVEKLYIGRERGLELRGAIASTLERLRAVESVPQREVVVMAADSVAPAIRIGDCLEVATAGTPRSPPVGAQNPRRGGSYALSARRASGPGRGKS